MVTATPLLNCMISISTCQTKHPWCLHCLVLLKKTICQSSHSLAIFPLSKVSLITIYVQQDTHTHTLLIPCLGFDSKVTTMKSLQKPKRIKIWGSDGEVYSFLLKKEDDLRNDARTMEFFYMINHFLRKNTESRDSDLCKWPPVMFGWIQGL